MNQSRRTYYMVVLVIILLIVACISLKKPPSIVVTARPATIADMYVYAQRLTINGAIDPPCPHTRNVYTCAGSCPWSQTPSNELVSCSFLPRIPHPEFVKYGMYCTPEPDQCPTYNAWTKDHLPPTTSMISTIPAHLLSNFTLNHTVEVRYAFQEFRANTRLNAEWNDVLMEKYHKTFRSRMPYGSYTNNDTYLVLDKYGSIAVSGKSCAVIGSEDPWIEAALLEYNASMVTTIEYASIKSTVPRLRTITPVDFATKQQSGPAGREVFDSVWSYSSLEHDGLGRYQDPLNPYGDLQTMSKITCLLKPGGFFFLGIPLNIKDSIEFNRHRIYGPKRLPLMYRYFHVVEVLGPGLARELENWTVQPFVVLQNKIGCRNS